MQSSTVPTGPSHQAGHSHDSATADSQYHFIAGDQPPISHPQTGTDYHLTPYPATGQRPLTPSDPRLADFDPYQDPTLATPSGEYPHNPLESDGPSTDTPQKASPMTTKGHPREGMAPWKWPMIQTMFMFILLLMGYDVSNIANIQSPIYHAFGHVELLPWVAVGYSAFCCALMPQYTRLTNIFGLKPLFLSAQAFAFLGCVISGASTNMDMLIIGRALNGIGCAGLLNLGTLHNTLLATPVEFPKVQGIAGVAFGIGLILGPIIGGAFAENEHATWRWAIYINLPILATTFITTLICIPPIHLHPTTPLIHRLRNYDWAGGLLHAITVILLCSVLIFSGSTWAWNSAPAIACWVLLGAIAITYILQQTLCLLTNPRDRVIPLQLGAFHRAVLPVLVSTFAISGAYGTLLYYTPLFFAFARGLSPIAAAVRLLPFLATFIFAIFFSSGSFPKTGLFSPFYILGGLCATAGGAALAQVTPDTTESYVMGLEALVGFGVGCMWQLSVAAVSRVVENAGGGSQGKRDAASMCNTLQLGGVAVCLSLAGCIFQNVGHSLLQEAVGGTGLFSDHDLREALAGLESRVWDTTDPAARRVLPIAIEAVTKALGRVYYVACAAGIVTFVMGLLMGFERVDFGLPPKDDAEKAHVGAHASTESHAHEGTIAHGNEAPAMHGTNYSAAHPPQTPTNAAPGPAYAHHMDPSGVSPISAVSAKETRIP